MVRDIQILVTEKIIAEVIGLPNEGIQWSGKYTMLKEVVESFIKPREELDKKGKGLNPTALNEPWRELEGVIQRYITYDGRYNVVWPLHLKLLATLKHRLVINLPFFLNAMLHEVAAKTQKDKYPVTIISHHGIVLKIILNSSLSQTRITWGDLIEADRPLQIEQLEIHQETHS
jgi:lambda repressor-like predicted transcriptional regulator